MQFFFFNDTATTEIYTLSLHDALPISRTAGRRASRLHNLGRGAFARAVVDLVAQRYADRLSADVREDRKSTRLNSSHANISYAVFCLKKNIHHHQRNFTLCHAAGKP